MAKERSFLEISALPIESISTGINLSSILQQTKYGLISEADKRDVIVLKEAFIFLDPKLRRVGVFTRSDQDHGTKIGQCSSLLCGNFDRSECTITQDGSIIYDVKDRLHNYCKEISGLFVESKKKQIPTIYYHDKERNKRYLFLVFELSCSSTDMPLCYRLDNRTEDLFVGMHDIGDVTRGLQRYNRSVFNVDSKCIDSLPKKRMLFRRSFSIADKVIEAKLASFTLIKFNLIGI